LSSKVEGLTEKGGIEADRRPCSYSSFEAGVVRLDKVDPELLETYAGVLIEPRPARRIPNARFHGED
jgi:hypothetical protein